MWGEGAGVGRVRRRGGGLGRPRVVCEGYMGGGEGGREGGREGRGDTHVVQCGDLARRYRGGERAGQGTHHCSDAHDRVVLP